MKRRNLLKAAWVTPLIATVALPQHAQASLLGDGVDEETPLVELEGVEVPPALWPNLPLSNTNPFIPGELTATVSVALPLTPPTTISPVTLPVWGVTPPSGVQYIEIKYISTPQTGTPGGINGVTPAKTCVQVIVWELIAGVLTETVAGTITAGLAAELQDVSGQVDVTFAIEGTEYTGPVVFSTEYIASSIATLSLDVEGLMFNLSNP